MSDWQPGSESARVIDAIGLLEQYPDHQHSDSVYAHRQRELKHEFLQFARTVVHPMDRSTQPAHLTASAIAVNPAATRVLLHHHKKADAWLQFGGHIDLGETIVQAALRETVEESGISQVALHTPVLDLDRHELGSGFGCGEHWDVRFVAVIADEARPTTSLESADVRWFPADRLPTTDDSVVRLVRAAQERLRS